MRLVNDCVWCREPSRVSGSFVFVARVHAKVLDRQFQQTLKFDQGRLATYFGFEGGGGGVVGREYWGGGLVFACRCETPPGGTRGGGFCTFLVMSCPLVALRTRQKLRQ